MSQQSDPSNVPWYVGWSWNVNFFSQYLCFTLHACSLEEFLSSLLSLFSGKLVLLLSAFKIGRGGQKCPLLCLDAPSPSSSEPLVLLITRFRAQDCSSLFLPGVGGVFPSSSSKAWRLLPFSQWLKASVLSVLEKGPGRMVGLVPFSQWQPVTCTTERLLIFCTISSHPHRSLSGGLWKSANCLGFPGVLYCRIIP